MPREVAPLREFSGQEGSRWINDRPTGEQVAKWFEGITLHEGMEHERYVAGITLISAREEFDAVVEGQNGSHAIAKRSQIVYTPYPKVDTRVAYFLDWRLMHAEEYIGWIEPVEVRRQPATQVMPSNEGMPPGFFYTAARTERGVAVYLCSTQRVVVYERQSYSERMGREPIPYLKAEGTKAVPVLRYSDRADDNAIMKAETGAKGRALGFAGMLIVPGAGVATAEDMQEAQAADSRPASEASVQPSDLPPSSPEDAAQAQRSEAADLRGQARQRIALLQGDFPDRWNEVAEWARERDFTSLDKLEGPALKGFVRKLDKVVDEAQAAQGQRGEGDDPLQQAMAPESAEDPS